MAIYQDVILQAVLFFPIIALLFSLPYMIHNYHKYGSFLSMRIAIVYSFILYLICIYFLVILPLPSIASVEKLTSARTQLIPFQFIKDIIETTSFSINDPSTYLKTLNTASVYQVLFNLSMTIPFGMYLRYYFKCSFKKTILSTFLLSLFFELTQLSGLYFIYPRSYRLFDIDDLFINTLGGILGYGILTPFMKVLPTRDEIDAASYKRGLHVSFPRRLLALLFDFIIIMIIDSFVSWTLLYFKIEYKHTLTIITLLYFIIIPLLTKGYTFGKRMTKTRITSMNCDKVKWYQYFIRYSSLYLVIDIIPLLINDFLTKQYDNNLLQLNSYMILSGLVFAIIMIYLLFATIEIATHKNLFYERLSKTKIISTISLTSEDNVEESEVIKTVENSDEEVIEENTIKNSDENKEENIKEENTSDVLD